MKRLLPIAALVLLVTISAPLPARAQLPAFFIESWTTTPVTLMRGGEFTLDVTFTNGSGQQATDVVMDIGADPNFTALEPGVIIGTLAAGQKTSHDIRVAVSNTITSGYYAIPLTFSYVIGGASGQETQSVGVYVQGLAPTIGAGSQPAFSIAGWSTDPATVREGEAFTLTLSLKNIGPVAAGEVVAQVGSGAAFITVAESAPAGRIGPGETQTLTLRGAAAESLLSGHYALPLAISYANADAGGTRLTEQKSIGLYVQGVSAASGRPQVIVEQAQTLRGSSGALEVSLTLRNTGSLWAREIAVTLGPGEAFTLAGGVTRVPVEGDLKLDETRAVSVPLIPARSAGGLVTQDFILEYEDYNGNAYQSTQTISIEAGSVGAAPRLLIVRTTTDPAPVTPGASVRLDLELQNVGVSEAQRVFVRLGQGAAAMTTLVPVGAGNVRFIEAVAGGGTVHLGFDLVADGSAPAGLVTFDVVFEYQDAFGTPITDTQTISLPVVIVPHFQIGFFEPLPEIVTVGDVFDLPVEVINIGRSLVNVSTVEVTGDHLRITDGRLYIGPLDGGTSGTLVATAEAIQAGAATIAIEVQYLDSFQQPQTITETFTLEVQGQDLEAPPTGEADEEASERPGFFKRLWQGILAFFGLGTAEPGAVQ
jgi:hypothetical protein